MKNNDWADHFRTLKGPFGVVRACNYCNHLEILKTGIPGSGQGYGMREGNKARGRIVQHIKENHPEVMEKKIHVFENAGLGSAPFKFVGVYSIPSPSLAEHNPTAYNNQLRMMPPGYGCGACSYCGMPIMHNYLINSADGRKFAVGCDCVQKTGDAGLIDAAKAAKRKAEREAREAKREADRKSRLQSERDRNGGLTDWEVKEKRRAEEKAARDKLLEPIKKQLEPFAYYLERFQSSSGFCVSVAMDLRAGKLPKGRGLDILLDILAKASGRRNSKAYEAEYERVSGIIYEVEAWLEDREDQDGEKRRAAEGGSR